MYRKTTSPTISRPSATTCSCWPATAMQRATASVRRGPPVRSTWARTTHNRESIYVQQQTISGEGLSGIAFSTNVPHTVRGGLPKGVALGPTQICAAGHVRDQDVQRLPPIEVRRQQRDHGPASHAGHELRQLHRPLLLGGRRRSRIVCCGRDRAGRAAGRHRQQPALRWPTRTITASTSSTAASLATPTTIRARTSATMSCTPSARPRS